MYVTKIRYLFLTYRPKMAMAISMMSTLMGGGRRRIIRRTLTTDLTAALRPFYVAGHPENFGKYPLAQQTNEKSLMLLRSYLESLSEHRSSQLPNQGQLNFYMRLSGAEECSLIEIQVDKKILDPHALVQNILRICKIKTENEEEMNLNEEMEKEFDRKDVPKTMLQSNLDKWMLRTTSRSQLSQSCVDLQAEIARREQILVQSLGIHSTRYDCGCNMERYCDCLRQLEQMAQTCGPQLQILRQRIVVFASYTGISLDGHVMLFTGDPPSSWYSFISEIIVHEIYRKLVPLYEQALSAVLLDIQIKRHNFMPPASEVKSYANGLLRVITSISEARESRPLIQDLPLCLSKYMLAIIPVGSQGSEQPKLSSTGMFLAPASCSGPGLLQFICNNLELANHRLIRYKQDIIAERQLMLQCKKTLRLANLTKDDSVTPDKMVCTLRHLLKGQTQNESKLNSMSYENISIHVTNYYSVLTDGIICIPWDFMNRKSICKLQ